MGRKRSILYDLVRLYKSKNNQNKNEVIAKAIIELSALPEVK